MKNRLYNVIFPIWFLIVIPTTWLYVLPANFLIDSLVLIVGLFILKIGNKRNIYKKSILKVFLFGFLADIIGSILLILTQFVSINGAVGDFIASLVWNPSENVFSLVYICICVLISALFIYLFNYKISFKKLNIDVSKKRKLAIIMAVLTAPYLFLYPSRALYGYKDFGYEIDTSNVSDKEYSTYDGDTYITRIFAESENYINSKFVYDNKLDKVTSSISEDNGSTKVNMYISANFLDDDINEYILWARKCSLIVFLQNGDISTININLEDSKDGKIIEVLNFSKEVFEDSFGIKISDLKNDASKLNEVIYNMK